jgi:polyphosphate:AMP phosphotransferase
MLETLDLSASLDKEAFKQQKEPVQRELSRVQRQAWKAGLGVLVLFEGWEFSGKVPCARFLAGPLDPRGYKVEVLYPPTRQENRYPFAYRYWCRLPPRQVIGLWVRSWYYHLLDPQVHKKASALEHRTAVEEICQTESMLSNENYLIVKFWLEIDKKEQRRRRREFLEGKRKRFRVGPDDPEQHKHHKRFRQAAEAMLAGTDTAFAPWHLIPANDERFTQIAVATTLIRRIDEALARRGATADTAVTNGTAGTAVTHDPPAAVEEKVPDLLEQTRSVLQSVDMNQKLDDEEYAGRLRQAQANLADLQYRCFDQRRPVVLGFEGWDAAGKGGVIKRLTVELDPRHFTVHSIAAPRGEEAEHPYLWRFWKRVPPEGHWAIFDRTWYGRVLVERVEGFAKERDWRRAYGEIRDFETALSENGFILLKFWLHLSPEEQLRRFHERQEVQYKNYKITPEDWRNREKWPQYEQAVEELVRRTSLPFAPWVVVPANDKNFARVMVLETIVKHVEEDLKRKRSRLRKRF